MAGVIGGALRTARRVVIDPRAVGVVRAAPRVVAFLSHAASRTARRDEDDTIVPVRPTPGLALQVWLDELVIAAFRHPRLIPDEGAFAQASEDVAQWCTLAQERGWGVDPASYHGDPPPPESVVVQRRALPTVRYERAAFASGWEPHPGEPGRTRWMGHTANRTAHVWLTRASVPSTSWIVCVHGFGMGANAMIDFNAFRAQSLTRAGVNVAVVVLPMHGPRAVGRAPGEGFMSIDVVDSMHGLAQAAWDLRRTIAWLRAEQGAEQVGISGQSLGGHVVALTAGLEPDLACVIAGIPVVDLVDLYRRHSPPDLARQAVAQGALGSGADAVHRVVSPLALPCQVGPERRFVFAGLGDRMATFQHAHRLWLHWDRPSFATYGGGHVGFIWNGGVRRFVSDALYDSGLTSAA